ncbi:MAG: hypothetical protein K2K97_05280 [Muribaculaceae bacterium]|nr:hypothetical protein [Muribaculaceae bacterium]
MDKIKALESLIHITNCNIGYVPGSPSEFNRLIALIKKKTSAEISQSTVKRLWGYVKHTGFPSTTVLNVLCKFNDFKDWNTFLEEISLDNANVNASSGFLDQTVINANALHLGDQLLLKWKAKKGCTLEYIAYMKFKVIEAHNIKLMKDDLCTLNTVSIGLPLFISNIQRGSTIIPAYIGAKKGGIQSIEVIEHIEEIDEEDEFMNIDETEKHEEEIEDEKIDTTEADTEVIV